MSIIKARKPKKVENRNGKNANKMKNAFLGSENSEWMFSVLGLITAYGPAAVITLSAEFMEPNLGSTKNTAINMVAEINDNKIPKRLVIGSIHSERPRASQEASRVHWKPKLERSKYQLLILPLSKNAKPHNRQGKTMWSG